MATIRERVDSKGRKKFDVRIRMKGQAVQTATFERITDAKNWIQMVESEIRLGRKFPSQEAKKRTLKDAIERYMATVMQEKPKSIPKQSKQLEFWNKRLGHKFIIDISPAVIAAERDSLLNEYTRRGKKRSPSTVARYMAALSHVFTIAMKEWDWIDDNPFRKVRKPKETRGRIRFLTHAELASLLEACRKDSNAYLYPIVLLAVSTGMRQSEILNLTWDDVNFERRQIILHETKNGESRSVPLTGEAYNEMESLSVKRGVCCNLVFPASRPTRTTDKPDQFLPQFFRKAWYRALKASGVKDFRFHDLRHTAASYMAMSGSNHNEIAAILGHKTLSMVHRYTHFADPHMQKAVERMNDKFLSPAKILNFGQSHNT